MIHKFIVWLVEMYRLASFLFAVLYSKIFRKPSPIIIYQMGKVGSSSIIYSLRNSGFKVFQVHRANNRNIMDLRKKTDSLKLKRRVEQPGRFIGRCWSKNILTDLPIIVMFRDPLRRNISAFFQNHDYFLTNKDVSKAIALDHLISKFLNTYNHSQPVDWLNSELLHFFPRVNVEFSQDVQRFNNILIFKSEIDDDFKISEMNAFLSTNITSITNRNKAVNKEYYKNYSALKREVFKDKNILALYDRIYKSNVFYNY